MKEKFGALRYYIESDSAHSAAMEALVDQAETASATICEICGVAGVLMVDDGWLKTLWPACARGTGYLTR